MAASLSSDEKIILQNLITSYGEVFAVDPKKPRLNNITKHSIDTQNSLPQFRKPYRIPGAYEDEVNWMKCYKIKLFDPRRPLGMLLLFW